MCRSTRTCALAVMAVIGCCGARPCSAQPYAYVPNRLSEDISVIDTASNAVVRTISVGSGPFGVAVHPEGTYVYVSQAATGDISVIDTLTNSVVGNPYLPALVFGIAVDSAGSFLYAALADGTVAVLDTATYAVVDFIPVGNSPVGVAVHPAGTFVYVTNELSDSVSVIDTSTNTVTDTVFLLEGSGPFGVAVNPSGSYAYVTNPGNDTVAIIDTVQNFVVDMVNVGSSPAGVALDPPGSFVYVANEGGNSVSVLDTTTNVVTATVPVGSAPVGVSVDPAGDFAYVVNSGSDDVSVIDTATNTVVATVPVGSGPEALGQFIAPEVEGRCNPALIGTVDPPAKGFSECVASSGSTVYLGESSERLLHVVDVSDPESPTIQGTVSVSDTGIPDIAVSGTVVYVANNFGGLLAVDVSNPSDPIIVGVLETPGPARAVAVSGSLAYLGEVGKGGGFLDVIDVSDPFSPELIGQASLPDVPEGIAVAGDYAYVAAGLAGLQVVDVSDPQTPQIVGSVSVPYAAAAVDVSGSYAYVAAQSNGLFVVDVSIPEFPALIGSVAPPMAYTLDVVVSGTTVYLADNGGGTGPGDPLPAGLFVVDVADPFNPTITGLGITPNSAVGVAVSGGLAFIADGDSGLQVFDVSPCLDGGPVANITQGTFHATIQAAIDDAVNGDVIEPEPGTYFELIDFLGKSITLRSPVIDGLGGIEGVVIDGDGSGPVVTFDGGAGVLDNITVTGGFAFVGGGILAVNGASPTITGCTIIGNEAVTGGGVTFEGADGTMSRCTIRNNLAQGDGGGVNILDGDVVLRSCLIAYNSSGNNGGGAHIAFMPTQGTLINCTIVSNFANFGGGVLSFGDETTTEISDSIVWGNSAKSAAQIGSGGGASTTVNCSDVEDGWKGPGAGNIDVYPQFEGEKMGDLRLIEGSPCINAGCFDDEGTMFDLDGNQRVQECVVDMGAYESPYFLDCNDNGLGDACEILEGFGLDDGISENGIGFGVPKVQLWANQYDAHFGSIIGGVSVALVGVGPMIGDPITVYVWDDPNDDGFPDDAVLLASATGTIQYVNNARDGLPDDFDVHLVEAVFVLDSYFVGVETSTGKDPAAIDNDDFVPGRSWISDFGGTPGLLEAFLVDGQCKDCFGNWLLRPLLADSDGDHVPDECVDDCRGDGDRSGVVDFGDVLMILSAWGNAGGPEDLDGSGLVDFGDLLIVLKTWGACPP